MSDLDQILDGMTGESRRFVVLAEIEAELGRQDAKWGIQRRHPDGTGPSERLLVPVVELLGLDGLTDYLDFGIVSIAQLATTFRHQADNAAKAGTLTWLRILLEEVFEALAEEDSLALEAELIQVAAVAAQWVQALRAERGVR